MSAPFSPLQELWDILLLESVKPTGSGGVGQILNDVEVLILVGRDVVYDYVKEGVEPPETNGKRFYADNYLELKDLSHVGLPALRFHSGYAGASDSTTLEHILWYDKLGTSFVELAPEPFFHSGRHGFRWLELGARTFVVIADENWLPAIPIDERCHYCPSPFQYDVYQWNRKTERFTVYRRLFGKKSYAAADQALDGDWPLIRSGLGH